MRKSKVFRSPVRLTIFAFTVLALAFFVLPSRWTAPLVTLVQPLLPVQFAADRISNALHELSPAGATEIPADQADELHRELASYRHRVAALSQRQAELEGEVAGLRATREWSVDGRSFGKSGRLIPARVLAGDLLSWRDSRLIAAGALQGVRREDGVLSSHFSIGIEDASRVRDGMAVMQAEALIGFVDQVGTHAARVRLLTDPAVQMKVRTGRWVERDFVPLAGEFWLVGRGNGRMILRDLDRRDVESGRIQVGDAVLSDPESTRLPVAMVVGRIGSVVPDHNNALLSTAVVEPVLASISLHGVYVFDPASDR
jgi:cell shape-determining protein MreC